MRTIEKLGWLLILSLIVTGTVFGQPGGPAGNDRGGQRGGQAQNDRMGPPTMPDSAQAVKLVDELAGELELTDVEKADVLDAHLTHFKKASELIKQKDGDRESQRRKMDALRNEFEGQMEALLGDKRFDQYREFMKKHNPGSGRSKPQGR